MKITAPLSTLILFIISGHSMANVIYPVEDVMTSSFFFSPNHVRGYTGEGRSTFRVSSDSPFGSAGAETVYIKFDAADISGINSGKAILTLQSKAGGFNADAGPGNPFTVSAHAISADPFTNITDDTNPNGSIHWLDFYNKNILSADVAAHTVVDSFGSVSFDVSAIVNDWVNDINSLYVIALTGKNDASGNDFLHGFANNTEAPGSTFLTTTPVPVPAAVWLMSSALIGLSGFRSAR